MQADKEIRTDLALGYIRDEDDYTSNFTGALRRNVNAYSKTGLQATSFLLGPTEERLSGTDAAVILTRGNESKVVLFEAKWPRFATPHYRRDYVQTASGISHFSDQLQRQKRFTGHLQFSRCFTVNTPCIPNRAFFRRKALLVRGKRMLKPFAPIDRYPTTFGISRMSSPCFVQTVFLVLMSVCACHALADISVTADSNVVGATTCWQLATSENCRLLDTVHPVCYAFRTHRREDSNSRDAAVD